MHLHSNYNFLNNFNKFMFDNHNTFFKYLLKYKTIKNSNKEHMNNFYNNIHHSIQNNF